MKYLIEKTTYTIRGPYSSYDGPIDGYFLVDVPDYLNFTTNSNSFINLVNEKYDELKSYYRMNNEVHSEFDVSNIVAGPPNSSKYTDGPDQRISIRPGGFIFIGTFVMPSAPISIVARCSAYSADIISNKFLKLNPNFSPTDVQFDLTDSTGVSLQTLSLDSPTAPTFITGYPLNFLLKITNTSSRTLIMSDCALLWST